MALTDTAIRNAKPKEKPYKVADSQGLYLLVNPRGSKLWRVKYRMNGAERKLALGAYPEITLAEARTARDAARRQLAHAVDPNVAKRQARIEASMRAGNSFASVAEELIAKREKEGVSPRTLEKYTWLLKLLGPDFGRRPVAEITPAELLHELKHHERRGRLETAKRMRSFASRVFRYAAATTRAERDPAQLLLGALIQPRVKHFAAITEPTAFGGFLNRRQFFGRLRYFLFSEHSADRALVMRFRTGHSLPGDIFLHRNDVDRMLTMAKPKRKGGPGRNSKYRYAEAIIALIGDTRLDALDLNDRTASVRAIKEWLADWFEANADATGDVPRSDQLSPYAEKIFDHLKHSSAIGGG